MLQLILFRHAKAEPSSDDLDDFLRVLAPQGRMDAPIVAAALAEEAVKPDVVLVSPSTRTRETWILAEASFPAAPFSFPSDLYLAPAMEILRLAEQTGANSVMVIAHNPGLHDLASLLARGDSKPERRVREGFPTSAAAVFERDTPDALWTLRTFLTAKDLRG